MRSVREFDGTLGHHSGAARGVCAAFTVKRVLEWQTQVFRRRVLAT